MSYMFDIKKKENRVHPIQTIICLFFNIIKREKNTFLFCYGQQIVNRKRKNGLRVTSKKHQKEENNDVQ